MRPARRTDPRSAAAALLSFLFPGLGQGYNGQWLLAAALAAPMVLVVGLGVAVVLTGGGSTLTRLLDARILVAIIALNVALVGWRIVAIIQAHARRGRLSWRAWTTWVTVGLVVITLAMHALPSYYAAKAIDTLGSVALEGGARLFDARAGNDTDIGIPSVQPEVASGERLTILLVGVDFAPGRTANLTDTMLVATVDPDTGRAALVSVPRDLYGVPIGDGRIYNAKLNSLLSAAEADRSTYPLGGPATLKAAISELLDTRIHYFAAIDMEGLREAVDTLGGIDVVVDHPLVDPAYRDTLTGARGFSIGAGPQHLDGTTALAYARSRKSAGETDFTRAERQQQILTAMAAELTAGNLLTALPGLLDAVRDNVATDIPSSRLSSIASALQAANLDDVDRVVLTPDGGYATVEIASAAGYILHPDLDAIHALGRRLFGEAIGADR